MNELSIDVAPEQVTLDDWLGGRNPVHLSTNSGSPDIAFQNWRRFKEAFAPEVVGQAFEETSSSLGRPVKSCIDPFGGSGTTALACQFLGVYPTTIEVNPYLADLIECKLSQYDFAALIKDFGDVSSARPSNSKEIFEHAPATLVEPGINGRFVFYRKIANRLADYRERIRRIRSEENRRLMRVLLASIAVTVSNVLISGKGRRYKRGWEKTEPAVELVDQLFADAITTAIFDIRRFSNRKLAEYELLRGDARILSKIQKSIDLAIFSPPYPNSFDYTDVYNIELWVGGYLTNSVENRALRMSTLRSHVQIKRPFECARSPEFRKLTSTLEALESVRGELWNRNIPDMVGAYFQDMRTIIGNLAEKTSRHGRMYIVVGDSRYAGVHIPVGEILVELAPSLGFEPIAEEPFRSMRASPQQGGKLELVESLLTLERR